ncbi:hypothetical protein AUTU_03400 [Aureibacter tunicatorum]|nr:hypothetical protein AUTU_03400 [Aureibacter tunicatorum]
MYVLSWAERGIHRRLLILYNILKISNKLTDKNILSIKKAQNLTLRFKIILLICQHYITWNPCAYGSSSSIMILLYPVTIAQPSMLGMIAS